MYIVYGAINGLATLATDTGVLRPRGKWKSLESSAEHLFPLAGHSLRICHVIGRAL